MGTFRLETIHIGDVVDSVDLSIGCCVRVGAAHHDCLVVGTGIIQMSLFLMALAITSLHSVNRNIRQLETELGSTWQMSLLRYLLEWVFFGPHGGFQLCGLSISGVIQRCSEDSSKQGSKDSDSDRVLHIDWSIVWYGIFRIETELWTPIDFCCLLRLSVCFLY